MTGLTGCLEVSVNDDGTTEPPAADRETATATPTPTATTTRTTTTTTPTGDDGVRTTTPGTPTPNCKDADSIPFSLGVGFRPTIDSVTPLELTFCVKGLEWLKPGEEEDYPDYLAPADENSDCFDLAPNEKSGPVWKQWGVSPCTYESLRVGIAACGSCFRFSDSHDHDPHSRAVKSDVVRWDLGPPGEHLRIDPGDELDITVYVDVVETDGLDEFELVPNGVTVRST